MSSTGGLIDGPSLTDGYPSVLFVHAHPDDETISTGALIVELVARGIRVCLLTATRGERGEVVPGPLSGLEGTAALSAERERELMRAATTLGVAERHWLGEEPARAAGLPARHYRDSGMTWIRPGLAGPAVDVVSPSAGSSGDSTDSTDSGTLAVAPLDAVTADVAALIESLRPSLVISYDRTGGYGHPDHVRMHEAALGACDALGVTFAEIVSFPGDGVEYGGVEYDGFQSDEIEWFALDRHLNAVSAALRCHASQLTVDGSEIVHSGGQRERIATSVGLRVRLPGLPGAVTSRFD